VPIDANRNAGVSTTKRVPAEALDDCTLVHRPRSAQRLSELERAPSCESSRLVAQLESDAQTSAARVAHRSQHAPVPTYANELPVVREKDRIAAALRDHQTVIVCGETGSGKSTQLPKILLELGHGIKGMIGHTQPRRIAARSIAARVAEELGASLGGAVGYKVRFSDHVGEDTYIKLMTDGVLLAEIPSHRELRQYDALIIDEAHERTLNIDFLLGYLKRLLPRRPELKLIIASATIEPQRFAQHFDAAPIIEVSGRAYPVEVRYRPLTEEDEDARERAQQKAILDAVHELASAGPGDVLVFLPGEREIRETQAFLRKQCQQIEILPLYARLATAEQQRVFEPHAGHRVVLATNVAETSLTVPGIRYVIDTGIARISRYGVRSRVQRLGKESISQASAKQRLGRCGRTAPGICIRLYAQDDLEARPAFTDPEIKRTNLAAVILQMEHLRLGAVDAFPFLDPPERRFINDGYKLLELLGAVDHERRLTSLGRKLARLPVDPRLARMILAAGKERCLREVLIIVAALSAQDPRERPLDKQQTADEKHRQFQDPQSDFFAFVKLWNFIEAQARSSTQLRKLCRQNFLSYVRLREWQDIHRQLIAMARRVGLGEQADRRTKEPGHYSAVHRALLAGLIDQIGYRDENREFVGARKLKFRVFPGSGLYSKPPKWLMAAELAETTRVYARIAARIEPPWIEQTAAHLVRREYYEPHWQSAAARVGAYERVTLWGLVLVPRRRVNYGRVDPARAREIFIREALVEGRYQTRAAFARHNHALIEQLRDLENRVRRRDILVEPEDLFRFYAERIPAEIHSGTAFEQWLKNPRHDQCLRLTRADLMRRSAEAVTEDAFPSHVEVSGARLPLSYRFEPGDPADGVTLTVPLAILNQLDPAACEWLVPGLMQEKIVALIKSLPKGLRRNFVPAPDFARACLEAISPADSGLTTAVAATLRRMTDVEIPPDAWSPDALPSHLQLRFAVVEAQRLIAAGRDLTQLQIRLRSQAALGFQALATGCFEQHGLTAWNFGSLSEAVEIAQDGLRVQAYPALIDAGDSVSLRLVDTRERARGQSRCGIRRLYMLRLKDQIKYLRGHLPNIEQACLLYQGIGRCDALKTELIEASFDRAFIVDRALPTDESAFEAGLAAGRTHVVDIANALTLQTTAILEVHHEVRKRLNEASASCHAARADIDSQLQHLVYAGFITRTPARWLAQLTRYLQAIDVRLNRLRRDPALDQKLQSEVESFWRRCLSRPGGPYNQSAFETYRWMLEEYRVSLFAQQLGTTVKVSAQRLEAQWTAVISTSTDRST
jgi:ATP-dependent helicase HrpA